MQTQRTIVYLLLFCLIQLLATPVKAQQDDCDPETIIESMYKVHHYFEQKEWRNIDRNWIRSTYYIGLMAFYQSTKDSNLLIKAKNWGFKHGWKTGSEWIYPANRMTCSQVYLELFQIYQDPVMIEQTKKFMDKRILNPAPAADQGWDYIDATFVGAPAYAKMTHVTGDFTYLDYANKIMEDIILDLYDQEEKLFYRDQKAKRSFTANNLKSIWARGNGWVFAALPRLMQNISSDKPSYLLYESLLNEMAKSLKERQRADGLWSPNLDDSLDFNMPETSASAFFIYGLAWGINNGILSKKEFLYTTQRAWASLLKMVDENGRIMYGQGVARKPEKVSRTDWHEYVSGAFLLAGSEMLKLCKPNKNN